MNLTARRVIQRSALPGVLSASLLLGACGSDGAAVTVVDNETPNESSSDLRARLASAEVSCSDGVTMTSTINGVESGVAMHDGTALYSETDMAASMSSFTSMWESLSSDERSEAGLPDSIDFPDLTIRYYVTGDTTAMQVDGIDDSSWYQVNNDELGSARQRMMGVVGGDLGDLCETTIMPLLGMGEDAMGMSYDGLELGVDPDDPNTIVVNFDLIGISMDMFGDETAGAGASDAAADSAAEEPLTEEALTDAEIREIRDGKNRVLVTIDDDNRPVRLDMEISAAGMAMSTVTEFEYGAPDMVTPTDPKTVSGDEFNQLSTDLLNELYSAMFGEELANEMNLGEIFSGAFEGDESFMDEIAGTLGEEAFGEDPPQDVFGDDTVPTTLVGN